LSVAYGVVRDGQQTKLLKILSILQAVWLDSLYTFWLFGGRLSLLGAGIGAD
jgi:hypothetical protein